MLAAALVLAAVPAHAQEPQAETPQDVHRLHRDPQAYIAMLEDPRRDAYQKPADVVEALALKPGETVADVGAGSGYFAVRLAKEVGPTGRVYAVDVSPDMVLHLNRRVRDAGIANLQTVLAAPDDPLLPDASVDRFFICDTWHHIEDQARYLALLKRMLRPGGQVVMIDFHKRELPVGPPLAMKIARDDLVAQMEGAGFRLSREHTFLPYQYFLVFTVRPGTRDAAATTERPNFVVVFADDLGYGDLGLFGHPVIRTPNLDRLAAEGQRWTSFYVGASVCTPSRAALLTGRYPVRSGMASDGRRVLFPDSGGGLPSSEITIAEALRDAGYVSGAFGKWHLGHLPRFLPTRQGFATYWGIPYSNDMDFAGGPDYRQRAQTDARFQADPAHYRVPILADEREVERPADQTTITRRYTEKAIAFIRENRDRPFFVYLAHSMVHIPLFVSPGFQGRSAAGLYGDTMEELDWSVGRLVEALRELGLERRTLVVFTSDNGPWREFATHGGSPGLLRGGKGDTFEGGMRVPTVFWGPGLVVPRVVSEIGSTLDLLPTFCALAGVDPPADRGLDGYDLGPVLRAGGPSPRDHMLFYRGTRVYAARVGPYKAHFVTRSGYGSDPPVEHDPPLLYQLEHDPAERVDVAPQHPEVLREIRGRVEAHRRSVAAVPDQLAIPLEP